jgi:hypothetical protein
MWTYGRAFDDKQLKQADASPNAIQFQHSRIICSFSVEFLRPKPSCGFLSSPKQKATRLSGKKENDRLERQRMTELCALAAGMMLAPGLP